MVDKVEHAHMEVEREINQLNQFVEKGWHEEADAIIDRIRYNVRVIEKGEDPLTKQDDSNRRGGK